MTQDFGLYIHWPFCLSKCPYCDFNSHVRDRIDEDLWRRSLLQELIWSAQTYGRDRRLVSIFFGGGTPSLMPASIVAALIDKARDLWEVAEDLEITLEANPTSAEAGRFQDFAQAGVNRLSLGIQALNQKDLTFLGRTHSADHTKEAIQMAAAIFPRFSFDLIYALPGQGVEAWRDTLEEALTLKPRHLSCYQLTYEPGTAFYPKFLRGELAYPHEDLAVELYETTGRILESHGLNAYEVSNYGAPGHECRHNLIYWRYQDYIGIGPGAHSRVSDPILQTKRALQTERAPETWLVQVEALGHGQKESTPLSPQEVFEEWMMMGLRLQEGIHTERCQTLTGRPFEAFVSSERQKALLEEGLLSDHAPLGWVSASERGRLVLEKVLSVFLESCEH